MNPLNTQQKHGNFPSQILMFHPRQFPLRMSDASYLCQLIPQKLRLEMQRQDCHGSFSRPALSEENKIMLSFTIRRHITRGSWGMCLQGGGVEKTRLVPFSFAYQLHIAPIPDMTEMERVLSISHLQFRLAGASRAFQSNIWNEVNARTVK